MVKSFFWNFGLTVMLVTSLAISSHALAAPDYDEEENANYVPFDTIVQDLQKQTTSSGTSRTSAKRPVWSTVGGSDPFENIWIHAGVGFSQTTQNIELPNGIGAHMAGRGVQAALGIDILGPSLSAEGSVRSFGENDESTTKVSLKEFDLRVFFKTRQSKLALRAGGGLSARYMTVRSGPETYDVTTPASVLSFGGDLYLTDAFSVGLDLSARNAMVAETFDKTSYDGTVRIDTHF